MLIPPQTTPEVSPTPHTLWFYDMNIDIDLLNFGKEIKRYLNLLFHNIRYSTFMDNAMTILNLVMHYRILKWLGVYQSWLNELVNMMFFVWEKIGDHIL